MARERMRRSERCRRTQPPRLVHGEQRPLQHSVTRSVMQITDYRSSYFGPRHFCSTHDAHRISCRVNRSSPREVPIGACPGNPRATSAYSSPGVSGVTSGTSASRSGGREARTRRHVLLGRSGRRNCGRDTTPIVMHRHPGDTWRRRTRGDIVVRHHQAGRPARRLRPGTASPRVPACSVTSSSSSCRPSSPCRVASSARTSSSCALPFLSVAGFLEVSVSPVPVAHGVPSGWRAFDVAVTVPAGSLLARLGGHQVQLRIATSFAGGDGPECATRLSAVRVDGDHSDPGCASSAASFLRLPPVVTPASSRGYDPLTGDEPRMNGRAVLRGTGVRHCHRIARSGSLGGRYGRCRPGCSARCSSWNCSSSSCWSSMGPRWRGPADRGIRRPSSRCSPWRVCCTPRSPCGSSGCAGG